jgi:hypothetical protein
MAVLLKEGRVEEAKKKAEMYVNNKLLLAHLTPKRDIQLELV